MDRLLINNFARLCDALHLRKTPSEVPFFTLWNQKRIILNSRKLTQVAKVNFRHIQLTCDHRLCRLALGGETVKNLCRLPYEFEIDQRQRKSS